MDSQEYWDKVLFTKLMNVGTKWCISLQFYTNNSSQKIQQGMKFFHGMGREVVKMKMLSENESTSESLKVYVQCLFHRTYLGILENCRKCLSTKICSKSWEKWDEFNKCFECLLPSIFFDGLCCDHNLLLFSREK